MPRPARGTDPFDLMDRIKLRDPKRRPIDYLIARINMGNGYWDDGHGPSGYHPIPAYHYLAGRLST